MLLTAAACGHGGAGWRNVGDATDGDIGQVIAVGRNTVYAYRLGTGAGRDEESSDPGVIAVRVRHGRSWPFVKGKVADQAMAAYNARLGWQVDDGGLLQRWNGTDWRTVATVPTPAGGRFDWPVVSGEGADDAWVAGDVGGTGAATYLAHWDGHRLTRVTAPAAAGSGDAPGHGLLAVSPTEAWTVGCDAAAQNGLIARWNGKAWHDERVPAGTGCLNQVVKVGGTLYAYGGEGLLRRTGQGWQPVPGQPSTPDGIAALVGDGSGGLWLAAGHRYLHLHDGKWSSYESPHDGNDSMYGLALAPVPGSGAVWAVAVTSGGEEGTPDLSRIQRYTP